MASITQDQFEQMSTEGQIAHLNSQLGELNGMLGKLLNFDSASQRWAVRLSDETGKLIREGNLETLH